MKYIQFIILSVFLLCTTLVFSQTKQEIKEIKKQHQVYDHGKIFKKAKRIALPGINLRFKLASKETVMDGSWKKSNQVKFTSWAMLNGIEEADFQEITDEFYEMYKKKLEDMGLEVLAPSEYENAKGYLKLKEKNTKDRYTVKKSWGMAQVYSAGERPFFVYPMTPLGPHAKFAKETKALVTNMLVTIDFAYIGFEVKRYGDRWTKKVKGESQIYPVIRLEGITGNQMNIRTDGTYTNVIKDQQDAHNVTLNTEISSEIGFSESIESCSNCIPSFAKKHWLALTDDNVTGSYQVNADKELYKKAVLDALDKYTDQLIMLYKYQKN